MRNSLFHRCIVVDHGADNEYGVWGSKVGSHASSPGFAIGVIQDLAGGVLYQ